MKKAQHDAAGSAMDSVAEKTLLAWDNEKLGTHELRDESEQVKA